MRLLIKLSFLFILMSCAKSKEQVQEVLSPRDSTTKLIQYKTVVIKGTSDDEQSLEYINIIDHSSFSKNFHGDGALFNGTWSLELDSIFNPRFLEFWAFSKSSYYRAEIFATLGDTVIFEIKGKKINFKGKNAVLNNFFTELYNNTPEYAKNFYTNDIDAYKLTVKDIYDKKIDFFNQYIKRYNISSKNFYDLAQSNLKFEYLGNLINPRYIPSANSDLYIGDSNGLNMILQQEHDGSENLFDINKYLDNISLEEFKTPDLLSNRYFKFSVNLFIRDYFNVSEYPLYSKEKLISDKKFIENNFDGELESYIIAALIFDYNKNGFGNSLNNIEILKELVREYENEFRGSPYVEIMNEIKMDLIAFDFKLTPASLDSKLIDQYGDTLTLNKIFNRSSKRIKVIDFWASWCAPCIDEIKKAKDFKDKLAVQNNVEWIYLSIDEDPKKWLKKSEELNEFLNVRNQYLVLNGKKSPLIKSLNVSWIPRYVIINKDNKIVLNNAPRPSDTITFKKIIDSIK